MSERVLSQDIRAGSLITKQGRCYLGLYSEVRNETRACALGAALYGIGVCKPGESVPVFYNEEGEIVIENHYPHLKNIEVQAKPCDCKSDMRLDLSTVIMHLNDMEGWPRESIADWLESLGY